MSLAEIEDNASRNGVSTKLVKDIVQELVNEGAIHMEKIGVSSVFWMFASEASSIKQQQFDKLSATVKNGTEQIDQLIQTRSEESKGREETQERQDKMAQLNQLKKEISELRSQIPAFAKNDPTLIDAMWEDAAVATEAANRWTDYVMNLRTWAKNNQNTPEETFNQQFDIPDGFDTFPIPKRC